MMLTGRRVPAEEGERLGFVNEVVAPDELMAAARRWAELIAECAPLSVRATKQAAMNGLRHGLIDTFCIYCLESDIPNVHVSRNRPR